MRHLQALRRLRILSDRHHKSLLFLAVTGFAIAMLWAAYQIRFDPAQLDPLSLALNALLLAPAALLLNGHGLALAASAHAKRISLGTATRTAALGIIADLAPVPGSLAARAGAMMSAGVSPTHALRFLLARTVLLTGVAIAAAALAVSTTQSSSALIAGGLSLMLMLGGGAAMIACTNVSGALPVILNTVLAWAVETARLGCAFAAIGHAIPWRETPIFTAATIVGSHAFVIPSGLGVGEALGALLAPVIGVSSAAAFIALALNRLLIFAWSGLLVLQAMAHHKTRA